MELKMIAVLIGMCIVFVAFSSLLYYGKMRTLKKKEPMNTFYKKKIAFLLLILYTNIALCYLVFCYGNFTEFFVIIVIFKCKDIVSVLIQLIHHTMCFECYQKPSSLNDSNTHVSVVSIIPVYDETEEELKYLVESIKQQQQNDDESTRLICIIEDHGKLKSMFVLTEIIDTVLMSYVSWKDQHIQITVTFGRSGNCPCVIVVKDKNMGKRDSLILSHDTFNVPRLLNTVNAEFRSSMRNHISRLYGIHSFTHMFCTDADTIICADSFHYLIETIETKNAVAACGLVVVNKPSFQFWNMVQNFQYMYGQYIRRRTESIFGKVTCLPGCITMFKIDDVVASNALAIYSELPKQHEFFKTIVQLLGTDRRLTTSFLFQNMQTRTVFDERAICLTNTPKTFYKYLAQRRRWGSNSYFNSLYIITGQNIPIITRFFALLDYLRMSLIYFRSFNTVLFLIKIVFNILQYYRNGTDLFVQLSPCISILLLPLVYFCCLCLFKPLLQKRIVYFVLGFVALKFCGMLLSIVFVSNFLWFCGDSAWTSLHNNSNNKNKNDLRV